MRALYPCFLAFAVVGCSDSTPTAPNPSSDPAPAPAARLVIEPVADAEPYFRLLDADSLLFKYSGGLIDCWLEETVADQPMRRVLHTGDEMFKMFANAKVNPADANSGFVVLTRRRLDGKELWDLKLEVELPGQRQIGTKLTGATAGLGINRNGIQGFSTIKQAQPVEGETTLLSVSSETDKTEVRLKCAPMKTAAN